VAVLGVDVHRAEDRSKILGEAGWIRWGHDAW